MDNIRDCRGTSRSLFRSKSFNPRDVYVPKSQRDALASVFDPAIQRLKGVRTAIVQSAHKEMRGLIGPDTVATWRTAGTARPSEELIQAAMKEKRRFADNPERVSAKLVELELLQEALWDDGFYCMWRGPELHAVRVEELRESNGLRRQFKQELGALATLCLEWFSGAGTLSPQEIEALSARLSEVFFFGGK